MCRILTLASPDHNNSDAFLCSGGMEELTLEQIKKRSELEEDLDFENGENH